MKNPKNKWIIKSLLDLDVYKLTMMQFAFLFYRSIQVVFGFTNRTKKVKIADFVKLRDVKKQLDHVRELRLKENEFDYLRKLKIGGVKIFFLKFLRFFRDLQLPSYTIHRKDGQFVIKFSGNWAEVTLWETICLSILNELYYRAMLAKMTPEQRRAVYKEGRIRLEEKIRILKKHPFIRFIEFGTRRRFGAAWQYYVISTLKKEVPEQLLGTSNVYLAMKLDLAPIGTFAHELFMVFSGVFASSDNSETSLRESHNAVLKDWWELYGKALSIALTDTYGSDFFFRDMTKTQAKKWRGLRHDSGDPIEFGEKAIRFYEKYGIDSREKVIVFSDGLDIEKIVEIEKHFHGRIQCVFGWGTNLTNDLGLDALSLVVKVVKSCGVWTVKLSDNIAKAMGRIADIKFYKKVFGYGTIFNEECVY